MYIHESNMYESINVIYNIGFEYDLVNDVDDPFVKGSLGPLTSLPKLRVALLLPVLFPLLPVVLFPVGKLVAVKQTTLLLVPAPAKRQEESE
jgi:hypothetical protein